MEMRWFRPSDPSINGRNCDQCGVDIDPLSNVEVEVTATQGIIRMPHDVVDLCAKCGGETILYLRTKRNEKKQTNEEQP
jgi:hypothetical protein